MTTARNKIVESDEVCVIHCIADTARQAFLCGKHGGRNYDHRVQWMRERLKTVAAVFAVEVGNFSITPEQFHVVVRQRPDLAKKIPAADVNRRWNSIFFPETKSQTEVRLLKQKVKASEIEKRVVEERRARLGNSSWFMRCVTEAIARRSNKEEGVKGRFWAGRFRSLLVYGDGAQLACSVHVDLRSTGKSAKSGGFGSLNERKSSGSDWMSPFDDSKGGKSKNRISNDLWLPIRFQDYAKLIKWTGENLNAKRAPKVPEDIQQIFDTFHIQSEYWIDTVRDFPRIFKHMAGPAGEMIARANAADSRWMKGFRLAEKIFR